MSVMIDGLKLKIPFRLPKQGKSIKDDDNNIVIMASNDVELNGYSVNLENLGVNYWQQYKNEVEIFESVHKFESLPSHYSGMALKIVQNKDEPCIWLFASPAKLMQGHNVYGTDNLEECALTMFNILSLNYGKLSTYLEFDKTEIQHIDVTASTRVGSDGELKQVLDFLRNVQSGQTTHNNKRNYQYTVYWGSDRSERKQLKVYAKNQEIDASLKHYKRSLPTKQFKAIAQAHTQDVRNFAKNLLRFEARLKKKLIKDFGVPTKLRELIKLQKANSEIMVQLWMRGFDDIMQALKGKKMKLHNDDEILKKLKSEYRTVTKSGKESYTKATKLFGFYKSIKLQGYEAVKCDYGSASTSFHRHKNDLIAATGLSLAFLQNLHKDQGAKIIPFIKYLDIDFENQTPSNWEAPIADNVHYLNIA